jgi:hypothetical protein
MDDPFDAAFYDDLDATRAEAWARLVRGAADRRSALHTVQVATGGPEGPRVRTVVLRGADPQARSLRFHTDQRSGKVAALTAEPRVEVCGYDPRAKIQLRLRGLATLHRDDALADAAWAATGAGSRLCYRAPLGPGTALDTPGLADPSDALRHPADPELGRSAFTAVTVSVAEIEWLYLAARGHRRAVFLWQDGVWRGQWLAP